MLYRKPPKQASPENNYVFEVLRFTQITKLDFISNTKIKCELMKSNKNKKANNSFT